MSYLECLRKTIKEWWIAAIILLLAEYYINAGDVYVHVQIGIFLIMGTLLAAFRYYKQKQQQPPNYRWLFQRIIMIYKGMLLSVLLIPAALTGANPDTRTEQLKKDLYATMIELSEIGKLVLEKQELIDEMVSTMTDLTAKMRKSLNDEEVKEFFKELNAFRNRINNSIAEREVKDSFVKEFCENKTHDNTVEKIKFLMIQIFVEEQILRKIVEHYEQYFKKTSEINGELAELQD